MSHTDVSSTVFAVIIAILKGAGHLSSQTKPYFVINSWIVLLAVVMIVICDDKVGIDEDNDDEDGIDSK